MSLADRVEQRIHLKPLTCNFVALFDKLPKEDQKYLTEQIEKGTPTLILTAGLRAEGYRIGDPTFNDHRYGRCRCPQVTTK